MSEAATRIDEAAELPRWDLSDLYAATDDPAIEADLEEAERIARDLAERCKGKLAALSGDDLAAAIKDYERMVNRLGKVGSYAGLRHATGLDDPHIGQFAQKVSERSNDIGTHVLFFTLEINRIPEEELAAKIDASADLAAYKPFLDEVRAFKDHQLNDELERLLHEKAVTGRAAWNRLFDETMAGLRFPVGEETLTAAEVFDRLSDKDRERRRHAYESISKVLDSNIRLFALITNTLAKDKAVEDKWRRYARPISYRNLSNQVEDEVVDALLDAVKDAYPRLSHRYYALKARWLGLDKLAMYDRNAPLPEDDDTEIAYDDAKVIVLDAYRRFSPKLSTILEDFFDKNWIDAAVDGGKQSGAFCHPTVTTAHPYVLMNYQGKQRDVMTLAHELGHGVHQVLAARQGELQAGTPLTLAETASVFGEQLTFQALLEQTADPAKRRVLLASKVEDGLNTVVRQIAFCEFERRLHDARKEGELTPDEIGAIWLAVQRESLGESFEYDEGYRHFWAYIPHFVHVPFYVYAYAFGDCLVNSLYAVYRDRPEGFEPKYLEMLRAGGTLKHKELLAPFDLDASDSAFWRKGLSLLEGQIDRLEDELRG